MIFSAREITTLFDYNQLFGSFSFSKNMYAFSGKHRNVFGKIRTCFPLNEKSLRENFPLYILILLTFRYTRISE